ncbi:MAG: ATP-binding protein [Blastocatellia bacterium]|nr:ATP-binding protein [Blastocatellia bacterium]
MIDETDIAIQFAANMEKRLRSLKMQERKEGDDLPLSTAEPAPSQVWLPDKTAPPYRGNALRGAFTEPLPDVEDLYSSVEGLAAVSGWFHPDELFGDESGEGQLILSRLSHFCMVDTSGDQVRWRLNQNAREKVLSRLNEQGRLQSTLEQSLPPTDTFGECLREVLRHGVEVPLKDRKREDLLALASAIESIGSLGLPHPDLAEVRRLIGNTSCLDEFDPLLNNGFFGRRKELQALKSFLEDTTRRPWTGLILTGIGGAGKSTLVAKFAKDLVTTRSATVVVLDFDRPGIDPNDQYWLEAEMARQVGRQYAEEEARLQAVRQEARQYRTEIDQQISQSSSDNDTEQRSLRSIVSSIGSSLRRIRVERNPFLLVLDTFEEVTQRDLMGKLLEWLADIAEALYPSYLKVIFSGRLYEGSFDSFKDYGITARIEAGELDAKSAERLLLSLGVQVDAARHLARSSVLPRRPLELKLLARLVTEQSEMSISEIDNDLQSAGKAGRELFTGIIYRRVLLRVRNENARALAYPGLVLRYVTPELVQRVLVPALNLPLLGEATAEQTLNELASYDWLAYRGSDGEVWHRKDLRRTMLKVMIAEDPEKARRVSRYAVEFFESGNEREKAEGIYHRLMLMQSPGDGENFELGELHQASEFIGADLVDLPPAATALLRFAIDSRVPMKDVELLPARYLPRAYRRTGQRLVNAREFGKALRLLRRGIETQIASTTGTGDSSDQWELETLYATASWDMIPNVKASVRGVNDMPLRRLADLIYPKAITAPESLELPLIEETLIKAPTGAASFIKEEIGKPGAATILKQLALSLVLISRRHSFSANARDSISAIVAVALRTLGSPLSARLERKLVLLDLIGSRRSMTGFSLSPSTIKLDSEWIANLQSYLSYLDYSSGMEHDLKVFISEGNRVLQRRRGKRRNARGVLGMVDALYKDRERWERIRFSLDQPTLEVTILLDLLRGPDSEFRDPCRFALLDAFPDRAGRQELGEIISSVVKLELDDLAPEEFADALTANPEQALANYVELVDRTWCLGELLRRAHGRRPDNRKLGWVLPAYEQWDEAVRSTIQTMCR